MSCNLEDRAEQYVGTCVKPEDVTSPLLTNPATGAIEPYLRQARYQRLCDAICHCSEGQTDSYGRIRFKNGCDVLAGPGHHCTCEMCERMEQFDNVIYPSKLHRHRRSSPSRGTGTQGAQDWSAPIARTGTRAGRRVAVPGPVSVAAVCYSPRRTSTISSPRCRTCRRDSRTWTRRLTRFELRRLSRTKRRSSITRTRRSRRSFGPVSTISSAGQIPSARRWMKFWRSSSRRSGAQESLQIQERTNALAEAGLRQIEKLARAVEKQTESIHAAYASNAFTGGNSTSQAGECGGDAREEGEGEHADEPTVPDEGDVLLVRAGQLQQHGASDCLSRALRGTQQPRRGGNAGVRRTQESHRVPVERFEAIDRRAAAGATSRPSGSTPCSSSARRCTTPITTTTRPSPGCTIARLTKRGRGHLRHVQR